ncbi:MAG TPA: LLM class flavin-dependent oxidoreductase, partial [Gemmatimonadales bacterium]|nr:LLM class flavin-dependent oxidoreductase [Gemmatimonadales bacterium]
MHYGISVPNFAIFGDCRVLAGLARNAEAAGWDGFFIWDHLLFWKGMDMPIVDPWVALAAIALATERVRIGPMVAPLARRRPWKAAREAVSIDHLSNGRLILGVGLGEPVQADFAPFGEATDPRVRARQLDESLDLLTGLWSGKPFSYAGEHFRIDDVTFLPPPVQSPRIPIWVAGVWPNKPPVRRAARWDGYFPIRSGDDGEFPPVTAADARAIGTYLAAHRTSADPIDLVITGQTHNRPQDIERVSALAAVGTTWWLESLDPWDSTLDETRAR